ncbi:Kelch-like protein [Orthopoxvirus akhmetapox]|nr:Kelch-like protein [Akhmeta virus]QEQ49790.1 Kelch-like protein [Akhmeta virus]
MFAVRFNFITRSDLTEAVEKIAPEYRRHLQIYTI